MFYATNITDGDRMHNHSVKYFLFLTVD